MEVKGETYRISYVPEMAKVIFTGRLRPFNTQEYQVVDQLLDEVINSAPATVTLDLRELHYLNSLGTLKFSRFVTRLHERGGRSITVCASRAVPWQENALKSLVYLVPGLKLEWV